MNHYFTFSLITKIGLLLILLSACSTPEEIQSRKCTKALKHFEKVSFQLGCPWNGLDSSVSQKTTIMYRDSLIYVHIPGETVHDSVLVPISDSISTTVSILNTKYAISKAWIENSQLKHTLEQVKSDIGQIIQGTNKETIINNRKYIGVPVPFEKIVKEPLSKLQNFLLWSGLVAWGLAIAWVIYRFRKFLSFRKWFG